MSIDSRTPRAVDRPTCACPHPDGADRPTAAEARNAYGTLVRQAMGTPPGDAAGAGPLPDGVARWLIERRLLSEDRAAVRSVERALRELVAAQQQRLRSAASSLEAGMRAIDDVVGLLPSTRVAGVHTAEVEFFRDRELFRKRLHEFDALGREEVIVMRMSLPDAKVLDASLVNDLHMLDQGVRWRMVVSPAATRAPYARRYLDTLVARGARLRVATAVPAHFASFDHAVTVLSLGAAPRFEDGDAIVHSPLLALCFQQVFEYGWAAGRPYATDQAGDRSDEEFTAQEREIVNLMALGAKDESIARRLGCSDRTLRRLMTHLMQKLGAASRFEAGARAARLGLLTHDG
ncbi:helix-turn-helix transcriptional regulator [Streptomyces sp. AC536]|uniref:helix-turn-helix transcriptional regulator n=1 Tax=Streptomyces buecherae TaxID=2763006 RepID=UPI00164E0A06|nr:LuxR C-terminal-related transcriptional regulator [Streptomyces buecherae]MBC3982330.1 helix-turn-helix transcriptional regulator [Streptomyces buecherae]QNJ43549.1 helix-turn-helix transcriptional regulator [Streptomyces buecherae]